MRKGWVGIARYDRGRRVLKRNGHRPLGRMRTTRRPVLCVSLVTLAALAIPGASRTHSVAVAAPRFVASAASIPALSKPSLGTTVPTPTVPTTGVPTPTVPALQVPTVTVPAMPTVPIPSLPLPSTPAAPSVHLPSPVRSSASSSSLGSLHAPTVARALGGSAGSQSEVTPSAYAGAASSASGAGGSAYATDSSAGDGIAAAGSQEASSRDRAQLALSPQAALRRLVLRLRGCLAALPPRQAQALVLRTGIGLPRDFSREEVARLLRVSLQQEGRIEHDAVAGLDNLSHARCAGSRASLQAATHAAVTGALALLRQSTPAAPSATPSAGRSRRASPGARQTAAASPATNSSGRSRSAAIAPPQTGGPVWLLLALITAGLLAAWFIFVRLRPQAAAGLLLFRRRSPDSPRGTLVDSPRGGHGSESALPTAAPPRVDEPDTELDEAATAAAAFLLATTLADTDDLAGAEAAYRRADEAGHASASSNLGVILRGARRSDRRRGRLSAGRSVWRRLGCVQPRRDDGRTRRSVRRRGRLPPR